jgi:hypothetical protein
LIIFNCANKNGIIFNEMERILDRIEKIAINEGIGITSLEKIIGASRGVLSRAINNGTDIQAKWIQAVVENYPAYSESWLLTGKGEMLRSNPGTTNMHNEKEQKPPPVSTPEPEMSTIYSMMFERIENMARELGRLDAENKQLKVENEELKKYKPHPSRYSFDSDSHNPPMVVDKSESEECKLEA